MEPIIKSILDNDYYKFTMGNAVLRTHKNADVKYKLFIRDDVEFPIGFGEKLREQIIMMAALKASKNDMIKFREACPTLPDEYFDWFSKFRFKPEQVEVIEKDGRFVDLKIEGLWRETIYWEVPLMAIISELYFIMTVPDYDKIKRYINSDEHFGSECLRLKEVEHLEIPIGELGTRRRFSRRNQSVMVGLLEAHDNFVGTSNVAMALEKNVKIIGTQAHEWFMYHAALLGFECANARAMDTWSDIYRGELGIALTDTFTTDVFLRSFDGLRARVYDGVRHDSGDPLIFVGKMIKHYKELGIDPMTKMIIFSDGLDLEKVVKIDSFCEGRINCKFGIGTKLTNNIPNVKPLNMVIKMTGVKSGDHYIGTVKLSDVSGKHTGKTHDIEECKKELGL